MASADKRLYSSTLPSWNLKRAIPTISPTAPASILRCWDRALGYQGERPFRRYAAGQSSDRAASLAPALSAYARRCTWSFIGGSRGRSAPDHREAVFGVTATCSRQG